MVCRQFQVAVTTEIMVLSSAAWFATPDNRLAAVGLAATLTEPVAA
ncbi:hypothetical protein HRUBRA_01547 [Pseudohaliea rubra DSM 19751]|uniref:Uncharacterized protein n=1 Tax=Pseudohaliea rubra DSM 19751 TaxID=1265313 RepID=A0A095VQZ7_9GAMM|nr:hypothetical protein HRUBRA_01547 [Pseudohaliea rubra DSM 19751]